MCFLKRKRGLIKKSIEISKLTEAKVYMTLISADGLTVTTYHSGSIDTNELVPKVKCLETFGPELDFADIRLCCQSEASHTIGAKHIKKLAEDGLVDVIFDQKAR
jgi:hypothetical protein